MNKAKELYRRYLNFEYRVSRGSYWVNIPQAFVPVTRTVQQVAMWKIFLWDYGVPIYLITGIVVIKFYLETYILPYFLGSLDENKWKFWKMNSEYSQKKEHLAPFNSELKDTLKEICTKLEIEHKFKEIDER